MTTPCSTNM